MEIHPIGKLIKDGLSEMRRTQTWLANECHVTPMAVTLWIKTGKIGKEVAPLVAKTLNLDVSKLLGVAPAEARPSIKAHYLRDIEFEIVSAFRDAEKRGLDFDLASFRSLLQNYRSRATTEVLEL